MGQKIYEAATHVRNSNMVAAHSSSAAASAFPRNDYVHRSQRAPTAVHLGKTTTRLHCGFLESKDAQDTASAHACADLGESRRHWDRPRNAVPRVKGCTGHSERPRLCGPRANYRDDYSSPRLGCWIRLSEEYPATSGQNCYELL